MSGILFRACCVFLFFFAAGKPAAAFDPESVRRALCEVLVDGHLTCTGFFVDGKGSCLTCAHAFAGGGEKEIELLLTDGRRVKARLLGSDPVRDAAVLSADLRSSDGKKSPFLRLAERKGELGERVFLAGTPLYRHRLFLEGSLCGGKPQYEYNPDLQTYVRVIYVHALAPRGTSGGPWLNERGEVVGIQSGCMARGGTQWGIAFAVPAEFLKALIADPRRKLPVGDLGAAVNELWELPPSVIRRFRPEAREGLVLCRLLKGGACDRAGLCNGDLLVAAGERRLRFREDLLDLVRTREPGDVLEVEVIRKEEKSLRRENIIIRLGDASKAAGLPRL